MTSGKKAKWTVFQMGFAILFSTLLVYVKLFLKINSEKSKARI